MNPDDGDPTAVAHSWISRCSCPRLAMEPLQNAFPLVFPALHRTGGQDQQARIRPEMPNIFNNKNEVSVSAKLIFSCAKDGS